jgi:hypothetical protein
MALFPSLHAKGKQFRGYKNNLWMGINPPGSMVKWRRPYSGAPSPLSPVWESQRMQVFFTSRFLPLKGNLITGVILHFAKFLISMG